MPEFDGPLVEPGQFCMLFASVVALGLYQAFAIEPNCDVVLLLHEAGARCSRGPRSNVAPQGDQPPLIIGLNLPVAATSRAIGARPRPFSRSSCSPWPWARSGSATG